MLSPLLESQSYGTGWLPAPWDSSPGTQCCPPDTSLQGSAVCPQGHIVHNWKARWFVLRQNTLLYYKLEGGRKVTPPKGQILLDGCTITCPCLEYENRPVSEGWLPSSSLPQPPPPLASGDGVWVMGRAELSLKNPVPILAAPRTGYVALSK